ncbi:MAG: RAD55 family ATPase, partial [Armatimonadota bacterium]
MSLPVPSGVPGLDEIVGGGIPAGSCVLIEGVPGAGKTTLGVQIAVSRARAGQRCLIIALEELPGQILRDAANFGWDLTDLERKGLMTLVCTSPDLLFEQLESGGGPVGTLLGSHEVDTVVLDSLDHLYVYGTPRTSQRTAVYSLINALKRSGVTAILTNELHSADPDLVPFEEYLSDVALRLTYELDANRRRFR